MSDELNLPGKMTINEAYLAIGVLRYADATSFGEYCRKNGITREQVLEWEA